MRTSIVVLLGAIVALAVMGTVPGPISRALKGFAAASVQALCAPGIWQMQVALSVLTVSCNVAAITFAARATGTEMPLIVVLTVPPLILTAMLLPISAGGWGLREGAAAAFWPLMGGAAAAGIAASISFGLVSLAASLPGLLMLIGPSRWRAPLGTAHRR
ncbi:MAG: lysylphosphatidylglycerol synthase domain-containing protein [Rhodobacterales bacterium]|nr:lysylphosphatidylglycerol synthase domain-containing protein [Rhodobacterales bacterium]